MLPDVGSRIVQPGVRMPSRSAVSTIHRAGRSLTEPVGLRSSSFAQIRTSADGDSRGKPTIGVWPTESSRESYLVMASADLAQFNREAAASDRGQDRHGVIIGDWCGQAIEESNVLIIEVDVDKPPQ